MHQELHTMEFNPTVLHAEKLNNAKLTNLTSDFKNTRTVVSRTVYEADQHSRSRYHIDPNTVSFIWFAARRCIASVSKRERLHSSSNLSRYSQGIHTNDLTAAPLQLWPYHRDSVLQLSLLFHPLSVSKLLTSSNLDIVNLHDCQAAHTLSSGFWRRPERKSANACMISSCVFITKGPCCTIGSPIGCPATNKNLRVCSTIRRQYRVIHNCAVAQTHKKPSTKNDTQMYIFPD
jgi:hypothetical protein